MTHSEQPFILTLTLNETLAQTLNQLREAHFPKERNFLAAHVTLFHALPSEREAGLRRDLANICAATPTFRVVLLELKHWGKGVFAPLEAPPLLTLRAALAGRWQNDLTPQDRQGYRPHVTLQNKVPKDEARALFETLSPTWHPLTGTALGLTLWRYAGGPWKLADAFKFAG